MTYMHSGAQGAIPVKGNSDSMVWKKGDAQRRPREEYSLKRAPWGNMDPIAEADLTCIFELCD